MAVIDLIPKILPAIIDSSNVNIQNVDGSITGNFDGIDSSQSVSISNVGQDYVDIRINYSGGHFGNQAFSSYVIYRIAFSWEE